MSVNSAVGHANPAWTHDRTRQGLVVLTEPGKGTGRRVDIIAVPGFNTNPANRWTFEGRDQQQNIIQRYNWLMDDKGLRKDVPDARIMFFEFNSQYMGKYKINQSMQAIAKSLLEALVTKREGHPNRPIIFVGHSMGGLVVAQAMRMAKEQPGDYPHIYECLAGCLFFGTPFKGSPDIEKAALKKAEKENFDGIMYRGLIEFMRPGSHQLNDLRNKVLSLRTALSPNIKYRCYYETQESDIFVNSSSAILDGINAIPIDRKHEELVRFESSTDTIYDSYVRRHLQTLAQDGPRHVHERMKRFAGLTICPEDLQKISRVFEGTSVEYKLRALESRVVPADFILADPLYKNWVSETHSSTSSLVVTGREGQGKTSATLALVQAVKAVVAKAEHDRTGARIPLLAYCFCDDEFNTAEEVLKTMIRQLIDHNEAMAEYTKQFITAARQSDPALEGDLMEQRRQKATGVAAPMNVEFLCNCLFNILKDPDCGPCYLVIANVHRLTEADSTLQFIENIQRHVFGSGEIAPSKHHWAFSTRPYTDFWDAIATSKHPANEDIDDQEEHLANPGGTTTLIIDLDSENYSSEVKNQIRDHAWKRLESLAPFKNRSSGLRHWARSLMGDKAPDSKWVDVACIQLEALEEDASDSKIRNTLERAHKDTKTFLKHQWDVVLNSSKVDPSDMREVLRALVLTQRDLTESEALILCDLRNDRPSFREIVIHCYPLVRFNKRDNEECTVIFANDEVKDYLCKEAMALMSLDSDEEKRQHWWLAMRCLKGLSKFFDSFPIETLDAVKVESYTTSGPSQDPSISTVANDGPVLSSDLEDATIEDVFQSRIDAIEKAGLMYAVEFWTFHGQKAGPDFARYLCQDDILTETNSGFLFQWIQLYVHKKKDFRVILDDYRETQLSEDGNDRNTAGPWGADEKTPDDTANDASGNRPIQDEAIKLPASALATEDMRLNLFFKEVRTIHVAAAFGWIDLLDALLKYKHEHLDSPVKGYTPLHIAASNCHLKFVNALLDKGAHIDAGNGSVGTALHFAAAQGHPKVMKALLNKKARPADKNAIKANVGPVINSAIKSGDVDIVRFLIEKDVNLHKDVEGDAKYDAPLEIAAHFTDSETFIAILKAGKGKWDVGDFKAALENASYWGRKDLVEIILGEPVCTLSSKEAEPDLSLIDAKCYEIAIGCACSQAEWAVVDILLEHCRGLPLHLERAFWEVVQIDTRTKIDASSPLSKIWNFSGGGLSQKTRDESLYYAANNNRLAAVQWLLEACGAKAIAPGFERGNAITAAAYDGELDIVRALLANVQDISAAINDDSGFPLQAAAQTGNLPMLCELVEKGAIVDRVASGCEEGTALQAACVAGRVEIVKKLLEIGADPNLGAGVFERPIIAATHLCFADVLECLLERPNVSVDTSGGRGLIRNGGGSYPIIIAAHGLPVESVRLLVEYGADINIANEDGDTALMAAAMAGNAKTVQYLCDLGADMPHFNKENMTALDISIENKQADCTAHLSERLRKITYGLKTAADQGVSFAIDLLRSTTGALGSTEQYIQASNSSAFGEKIQTKQSVHQSTGGSKDVRYIDREKQNFSEKLANADKARSEANRKVEELEKRYEDQQKALSELEKQNENLQRQYSEQKEGSERLQAECSRLKNDSQQRETELTKQRDKHRQQEIDYLVLKDHFQRLDSEHVTLKDRFQRLDSEHSELLDRHARLESFHAESRELAWGSPSGRDGPMQEIGIISADPSAFDHDIAEADEQGDDEQQAARRAGRTYARVYASSRDATTWVFNRGQTLSREFEERWRRHRES